MFDHFKPSYLGIRLIPVLLVLGYEAALVFAVAITAISYQFEGDRKVKEHRVRG